MSQQKSYKRNKDERFSITMGILLITLTALGAWLIPPMPAEGGLVGIFALAYGVFGPALRLRSDRAVRTSARIARQKASEAEIW